MEIRKCLTADYPNFLEVLNASFENEPDEWFQKEHCHCTPYPAKATAEEIERHWICLIDGKIVGGLGAYPADWVVSNSQGEQWVISAYGIGQVCCLPEYRSRGVMSALMKAAEADMKAQGRPVGYLGGNRRRYGHFGYDFGGNMVRYGLDKKLLELVASANLDIRQAELADWPDINKEYETQPSYVKRSPRNWELHFSRIGIQWFIGQCDGRKGYMAIRQGKQVCELYGDPGVLAAMLLHHTNNLEEGKGLSITYAAQDVAASSVGQMLDKTASWADSSPIGLFVVIDAPKLLDELQINHTNMTPAAKYTVARQLLNFTPLSQKALDVQPLCAWISKADSI